MIKPAGSRDERVTDILVIGSGIAGLTYALESSRHGDVLLITKKERAQSNTNWAQGGVAAVLGEDDRPELHVQDTLSAGAGLCHRDRVEILVREGPERVRELIRWGAEFETDGKDLSLGREGGHSRRRIVHAADRTGNMIEHALLRAVAENPRIEVVEDHLAVDLLIGRDPLTGQPRCGGAQVLDHDTGRVFPVRARITMLAAGGAGQVYRHTTNPSIATGDGLAMAYRAGAVLSNLEFIQFHPTALFPTEDPAFLISEAVRGEGGALRRQDGTPFMDSHHPMASLAPRDIVARAIDRELRERNEEYVILDVSGIDPDLFESRFPGIAAGCRERGIEPSEGIPVVPAAHYVCGGVVTDAWARTSIHGLLAAGETACTGVHGANRLASNSLLEALVFSRRASVTTGRELGMVDWIEADPPVAIDHWGEGEGARQAAGEGPGTGPPPSAWTGDVQAGRDRVRRMMWESAGIVRSDARLAEADETLAPLLIELDGEVRRDPLNLDLHEFRNLTQAAHLIVRAARLRKESRGLHFNVDHPWRDNEGYLRDTLIRR
jgi:L-aspartate oxidase